MMARKGRFADLAQLEHERERLDARRRSDAARLEQHLEALQDKDFRKVLIKNTVNEGVAAIIPGGLMGALLGKGNVGTGLSMAIGANKAGLGKRALLFSLGTIAPSIVEKLERISLRDLPHELAVSLKRVKEYVQERMRKTGTQ